MLMTKDDKAGRKLRMTNQRALILRELQKMKTHPTVDEIYLQVRRVMPHISLGTVYRNVEVLYQLGLALKLDKTGGQMRFDGRIDDHNHIRCQECGRVDDLVLKGCPDIRKVVLDSAGYEIVSHSLDFVGICPGCRPKNSPQKAPRARR